MDKTKEVNKPKKGDYTIKIKKGDRFITCEVKEVDEKLFVNLTTYWKSGRDLEGIRIMLKDIWLSGDPVEEFFEPLSTLRGLQAVCRELIEPAENELKKN